ncbi:MAG: FprA family A-type flavoprotein [Clostridiales bacterium]|nr:FprA family A-type flavoprotein [Clostridiales bacterium]
MYIREDIKYIGVNDRNIDLFEGQYTVENGMAYNSYVILDNKIAVMDSVDAHFTEEWLNNIKSVLGDKSPDYLVVQHMEPDHSASIDSFTRAYPTAVIVATAMAFTMMGKYFENVYADRRIVVKDSDTLSLGKHTLTFCTASMVHWPEVMVSFDSYSGVLFSADAFGKFGTTDTNEDWACEARRYYFGIVGKYGPQVQAVLKKLGGLDIKTICPLHGPVLTENLGYYLDLYNTWSSYGVESEGVAIAYTSVYGHTKVAVDMLVKELESLGCPKIAVSDLARCDMAEAVEDAFRYGKLVLATTTYNSSIFPFMSEFIHHLTERNYQNRKIGIIENGSWAPVAAKTIKKMLEGSKDITFTDTVVTVNAAVKAENISQIKALAEEIM